MAKIKPAQKAAHKSYVRYDIKYSLSLSKNEYINAIEEFNFTKLNRENKTKYLMRDIGIKMLINTIIFAISMGIYFSIILIFKRLSTGANDIDGFYNSSIGLLPYLFGFQLFYSIIWEIKSFIKLNKTASEFIRLSKSVKKYPKHMISISDDLVKVARIKLKKQKLVVETIDFKTWKIRGLIPYNKYGLKNYYLLTTTFTNLPIYIKDKKKAKKLGEIVNGWAK